MRAPPLVAELMVTATKRPASLGRIAAGVSAISHEQLEVTASRDAGDTTGQLAGMLMTNLGPGRDKLMIRGLSDGAFTGRTRSTVGTYLDDTPINFNAPDPDLRLTDVERIEVMRGPQGALYGSGSISGVYRIVTRKPDLDGVEAGVLVTRASTKGGAPSTELEAYGNVVLVPSRIAVRAVAYHDVQGGYLDNASLRLSNVDRTGRDGGRLALRIQATDNWQVDISGAGQRLRSNDSQYTAAGQGQRPGNRVQETHKNDFAQGAVVVKGELGRASLQSSTAWVQHTYSSQFDAGAATADPALGGAAADLGLFHETSRVNMLVQDLVLRSSGSGAFGWLVGVYGADTSEKDPSTLGVAMTSGRLNTIYQENRHDRMREAAVYGEASWQFADGWTAAAGGRLFETRIRTLADIFSQTPGGTRTTDNTRRFDGFSPMLSVQRELGSGDLVYALYSEGYRPGGFNSGGLLTPRATRAAFASDRLQNYEVGAKLRLLDRRLSVRGALYYDEWSNIQTDQYRPSGLSYTANVGDARILGLETELGYDFPTGLSLQANALISEPQITRANPDFAAALVDGLPGVPRVSGGVLALYERPVGGFTLRFVGEASYVGRSYASFDASYAPRMGDYLRARLSAEIAAEHWSAGVFVANPTNSAGDTFAYGNPFTFRPSEEQLRIRQVTPQRPRTVGLRLAAAF